MSEIARVEEEANLILTASVIDNRTSGQAIKGVGTILSELKADGKIEDYDTTENADITNIKFDVSSITLGAGDNKELTATFESGSDAGGYYVQIKGKKYPVSKINDKIEVGKTEITTSGNSKREIKSVETSNSAVATAEIIENDKDKIKVTGLSKGTAEITVEYTESILAIIIVNVKGYVEITVQSNDIDKGIVEVSPINPNNKYLEGSTIQLTATSKSGYELTGWYVTKNNGTEEKNPISTKVTAQYQIPDDGMIKAVIKGKFDIDSSEIAKGINSETYGKYVNYNIDLGIGRKNDVTDDWKVFYDDGTNIYIIAADYVPVLNTHLARAINNMGASTMHTYCVSWNSDTSFKTYKNNSVASEANGAEDIFINRPRGTEYLESRGLLGFWKEKTTSSSYINAKMAACMLDTKVWEEFSGGLPSGISGTCYAIGGPTLSMWVESWNTTRKTRIYYNNIDGRDFSYYIGLKYKPTSYFVQLSSTEDFTSIKRNDTNYTDDLYFPHTGDEQYYHCGGYALSSPSIRGTYFVEAHCNGTIGGTLVIPTNSLSWNYGLRPVVCLPSGVELVAAEENDNLYNITNGQNINE